MFYKCNESVRKHNTESNVLGPENIGCIPLAVVTMTFSDRHTQLFIISDLYRVLTEFAEVHIDIARSILTSIRPMLP